MKKFLTILTILLSINTCFSQNGTFSVKNNLITWEKEFSTTKTIEEVFSELKHSPIIYEIAKEGEGYSNPIPPNCDVKGGPIYKRYPIKALFFITKTQTGYKVTASGIVTIEPNQLNNAALNRDNMGLALEVLALKNDNTIRTGKNHQKALSCINQTLTSLFSVQ